MCLHLSDRSRRRRRRRQSDQLSASIRGQRALAGYSEGAIAFPPTYKYELGHRVFESKAGVEERVNGDGAHMSLS